MVEHHYPQSNTCIISYTKDGLIRKCLFHFDPTPVIMPWNVHVPRPNEQSTLFKKRPFWVGKYYPTALNLNQDKAILIINGFHYLFEVGLYKPLFEVKVKFIWLIVRLQRFFKKRHAAIVEKQCLKLAVCMSRHGRLGKDSALNELPDDIFAKIVSSWK